MNLLSSLGIAPLQADDAVYVAIYPDDPTQDLEALRVECTQLLLPLLTAYIWQKDRLHFHTSDQQPPPWVGKKAGKTGSKRAKTSTAAASPPCLWSTLCFGDNIEDEWFVVFLVKTLTKQLSVDTNARVWDNDGEFLLIEAAYELPKWIKPETSENRLWWRKGELVLIPPKGPSHPHLPSFPNVEQALTLVREGVHAPQVQKIQKVVDKRLSEYSPCTTTSHMHRAHCILPLKLAHILRREPQLVAAAVEAFYYRDPVSTKIARRMAHFPPDGMVPSVVCFNRCMYAQLKQQEFHPPKGFSMPPLHSPEYAAADLGLKLMFGMEVVYQESNKHDAEGTQQRAEGSQPDRKVGAALDSNPSWCSYLKGLELRGYFKGNIPGSQVHSQLLRQAQEAFLSTEVYERSVRALTAPGRRIAELLQEDMKVEDFKQEGLEPADSDDWMAAEGLRLERELNDREAEWEAYTSRKAHKGSSKADSAHGGGAGPESGILDADSLAKVMHQFVEHMSGLEGVEVPKDTGGVRLNSASLWDELCSALGAATLGDRPPSSKQRNGGGEEEDDDDTVSNESYTTTEGSSFFEGSDVSDDDGDASEGESDSRSESDSERTSSSSSQLGDDESERRRSDQNNSSRAAKVNPTTGGAETGHLTPDEPVEAMTKTVQGAARGANVLTEASATHKLHASLSSERPSSTKVMKQVPTADTQNIEVNTADGILVDTFTGIAGSTVSNTQAFLPAAMSAQHRVPATTVPSSAETAGHSVAPGMQQSRASRPRTQSSEAIVLEDAVSSAGSKMEVDEEGGNVGGSCTANEEGGTVMGLRTVDDNEWEVKTATDSDDELLHTEGQHWAASDGDEDFDQAYDQALRAELAGTTMAQSFERAETDKNEIASSAAGTSAGVSLQTNHARVSQQSKQSGGGVQSREGSAVKVGADGMGASNAPGGVAGGQEGAGNVEEQEAVLQPVDVDMNLVKSLLRSHAEQHGLPGPATGLLGLLGVSLPKTTEREEL